MERAAGLATDDFRVLADAPPQIDKILTARTAAKVDACHQADGLRIGVPIPLPSA